MNWKVNHIENILCTSSVTSIYYKFLYEVSDEKQIVYTILV